MTTKQQSQLQIGIPTAREEDGEEDEEEEDENEEKRSSKRWRKN